MHHSPRVAFVQLFRRLVIYSKHFIVTVGFFRQIFARIESSRHDRNPGPLDSRAYAPRIRVSFSRSRSILLDANNGNVTQRRGNFQAVRPAFSRRISFFIAIVRCHAGTDQTRRSGDLRATELPDASVLSSCCPRGGSHLHRARLPGSELGNESTFHESPVPFFSQFVFEKKNERNS